MFRPYMAKWVQPIAVYGSKGAADGDAIFRLLMKCIIALEECGARVVSTVCDGAQANKAALLLGGITGDVETLQNSMKHPTVDSSSIYFMIDPPLLFKCIRNHIFNKGVVQCEGQKIEWDFVKKLYEVDISVAKNSAGLRKAYKLKEAHIKPNNFLKMNVRLAVQVLSRSVSVSLDHYRKHPDSGISEKFSGSEATAQLFLLLNDSFDVMNARYSKEGINENNWVWKKEILNKLLEKIENTEFERNSTNVEGFVSATTMKALRLSILSTMDLVSFLLQNGFKFVLTGKFNQDCLECFFGIIRYAGGSQDQPTISSFLQLYRMLTIYYPTKTKLTNTNVDDEERTYLLTSYKDCLLNKFKKNKEKLSNFKKYLKNQLVECLGEDVSMGASDIENDASEIVFHLGGFILRSSKKNVEM